MSEPQAPTWASTSPAPLEFPSLHAGLPCRSMSDVAERLAQARRLPLRSMAQALLELSLVSPETLARYAANAQQVVHEDERALITAGMLTEQALEHARAYRFNLPEIDPDSFDIEAVALTRISWEMAVRHHVLPLGVLDGVLYVASSAPLRRELEIELGVIANCPLSLVWAPRGAILKRLARETQGSPQFAVALDSSDDDANSDVHHQDVHALLADAMTELRFSSDAQQQDAIDDSSSVIRLVNRMIMDAYDQKASDIHIETNPGDEVSRIRFRKDGDLEDYLLLPSVLRAAVVSRIKIMSRLDISERRRPQDGKINFHDFVDIKLEMRVAVLPTHDNLEDVVLRLLATSKPMPLQALGFSARDERIVKRLAEKQFGLILACGPTGSGKTTTLHSLLAHINTDARKIWTAEDPIEITQKGLRQLQVNPKIGVTFASAMRAFLRADPDVIMIGEVRDQETASTCVEASLTGHLVLSTLHTNSAAESVIRLLDLGMDAMNFGDSLIGIVAQRLVRGLCRHCAKPHVMSSQELAALVEEYVQGTALTVEEGSRRLMEAAALASGDPNAPLCAYEPVGCEHCKQRGYKGRMGIYEILENIGNMKVMIQARRPTSEIFMEASRNGMRTLHQDALEKVVAGLIDLKQARLV